MLTQIRELLCDETGVRYSDEQLQNYIDQGEALAAYIPSEELKNCTSKSVDNLVGIVTQEWVLFRAAILGYDLEKARIHLNAVQMLFKTEGEYSETCIDDGMLLDFMHNTYVEDDQKKGTTEGGHGGAQNEGASDFNNEQLENVTTGKPLTERFKERIDDIVCKILYHDGPGGHIDGHEVITDFIFAVARGEGREWADRYIKKTGAPQ